ncbi:putative toxin-antitoxin system, antitoxin component, PHD family [Streptococcus sp. C150]|nr:putative toxin-antitoxin system, antitoxin component, PHD family [Streptococcus sp. C150]
MKQGCTLIVLESLSRTNISYLLVFSKKCYDKSREGIMMQINLENLVPISEANQNFSKVARMVDSKGTAVILKNNKPKYVLVEYDTLIKNE